MLLEHREILELMKNTSGDLQVKLKAIDDLLGSPAAVGFNDQTLDTLVNDVIRLNRMNRDMVQFAVRIVQNKLHEAAFSSMAARLNERNSTGNW